MKIILIMIFSLIAVLIVLAFFTWDDMKTTRIRALEDAQERHRLVLLHHSRIRALEDAQERHRLVLLHHSRIRALEDAQEAENDKKGA